jgi:hypothetical protein
LQRINALRINCLGTSGCQQLLECQETVPSQVAQLLAVGLLERIVEAGQQLEAVGGDLGHDHSAVLCGFPRTRDQAAFDQAVEKAGDIGVASDHSAGNFAAGQAVWRPAEDAEDVVLRGRQVFGLENLSGAAGEQVAGAEEVEEGEFFEAGGTALFVCGLGAGFH